MQRPSVAEIVTWLENVAEHTSASELRRAYHMWEAGTHPDPRPSVVATKREPTGDTAEFKIP